MNTLRPLHPVEMMTTAELAGYRRNLERAIGADGRRRDARTATEASGHGSSGRRRPTTHRENRQLWLSVYVTAVSRATTTRAWTVTSGTIPRTTNAT